MRFLDEAMRLADFGWSVFPLAPGTKLPAISKKAGGQGVLDASIDPGQIREWGRRFPRANIGIACGRASGLTVIDFDTKSGAIETVKGFKEKGMVFSPTLTVRTPSGGWHLYYSYAPELMNSKSLLGAGIDVRNDHGYVVAPPSILKDGKGYNWIKAPLGPDVPKMPTWAFSRLKPKPQAAFTRKMDIADVDATVRGLVRFVEAAPHGQRNSCLYWAAMRCAQNGISGAEQALEEAALSIGLDRRESSKTIGSAFKRMSRLA